MDVLIWLLVVVAVLGIAYWAITQIPMPPPFRVVVSVVFAIVAIILLLSIVPLGGSGLHLGCMH